MAQYVVTLPPSAPLTPELMDAERTYVGYSKLPFFHPQIS